MLEGTPQQQAQFLINTLSFLDQGQLTQYLGDVAAANDISRFVSPIHTRGLATRFA